MAAVGQEGELKTEVQGDVNVEAISIPEEDPFADLAMQPPTPTVNPYYSVARQRARQRIQLARTCHDIGLKQRRLAAAIEEANYAGLPEPAIASVHEELQGVVGAARAQQDRPRSPEPVLQRSPSFPRRPLRPVSPVQLQRLGSLPSEPKVVGLLTLRDDGMVEVRDAFEPRAAAVLECRLIEESAINEAAVFLPTRTAGRPCGPPREAFRYEQFWEVVGDPEPFRCLVAVVDPLRPGGQLLCSRLLRRGPQGSLVGIIATTPCWDTPPPLCGPSYAALQTLLSLGAEDLGLGGRAGAGGGVFGRCLAFIDRAVAYTGGWPSTAVGQLAFEVVRAAGAARGPGGTKGAFLFGGCEPGSEEELARATACFGWLRRAAEACHAKAWQPAFVAAGVLEAECRSGLQWLDAGVRAGRWPGQVDEETRRRLEEEALDAEDGADVDAADREVDEITKGASQMMDDQEPTDEVSAPAPDEEAAPAEPPVVELPEPPPIYSLSAVREPKVAVPFGQAATTLLSNPALAAMAGSFQNVAGGKEPPQLPKGAEVVVVADFTGDTKELLALPGAWRPWVTAVEAASGVLAAVVLLPAASAADASDWRLGIPALNSLIDDFHFVLWAEAACERTPPLVAALLDAKLPLRLLQAHLVPFSRLHFAVGYAAASPEALAGDRDAARCFSVLPPAPEAATQLDQLESTFAAIGASLDDVRGACRNIRDCAAELRAQCMARGGSAEAAAAESADGEGNPDEDEPAAADEPPDDADADGADDGGAAAAPAPEAAEPPTARLLAFYVGSDAAAGAVADAMTVPDDQEDMSLAYPESLCGAGRGLAGSPRVQPPLWGCPWGQGGTSRNEVAVLAVHSLAINSILARFLAGTEDPKPVEEPAPAEAADAPADEDPDAAAADDDGS